MFTWMKYRVASIQTCNSKPSRSVLEPNLKMWRRPMRMQMNCSVTLLKWHRHRRLSAIWHNSWSKISCRKRTLLIELKSYLSHRLLLNSCRVWSVSRHTAFPNHFAHAFSKVGSKVTINRHDESAWIVIASGCSFYSKRQNAFWWKTRGDHETTGLW